jgi:hypothetical protein
MVRIPSIKYSGINKRRGPIIQPNKPIQTINENINSPIEKDY